MPTGGSKRSKCLIYGVENSIPILGKGKPRNLMGSWDVGTHCCNQGYTPGFVSGGEICKNKSTVVQSIREGKVDVESKP